MTLAISVCALGVVEKFYSKPNILEGKFNNATL